MTTAEILAAARAKKATPAAPPVAGGAATPETSGVAGPVGPRQLSASDILAIANGQQSLRREQPLRTDPRPKPAKKEESGVLRGAPARGMINAEDIRAMGDGGRSRPAE
jgi:hypothetical protein